MSKRKSKRWTKTDVKKKSKGSTGPPMCKLCHTAHWGRDPHKYHIVLDDIKVVK